ncbi:hypothetical protein PIB30_070544 [Stylosanthes scabra]|uniref:Uncharacterized protein n=1 Tax=Stylosanthes scabra TaxID=79078 RepID=A0ABU6VMI4_9FABA|nr:hypothetical protein [Stylosanthes scabra]
MVWSSGKYEQWSSSASSGSVGLGYDNRPGELTVWRFIRTKNPWVGDSHSVYYQAFQVQVQAWKVGEAFLRILRV